MRIGRLRFAPRLIPTLAAAVTLALLLSLGRWQVMRAEEKASRQTLFEMRARAPAFRLPGAPAEAGALIYRRVTAEGRYLPERQIFIDNRIHEGRAGFHVVTPLRLEGGAATVLVNRGWVARTAAYPRPPEAPVPQGSVVVSGMASVPPARVLELSQRTVEGDVWQNLLLERFRERTGLEVMPIVVLATPPSPGLAAVEERPDAGVAKHQEYALTWFSLAATVATLWIGLNLRRQ